eukprot:scaffold2720_cov181-Alexandrium_tamarense.AAC.20
MRLVFFSSCLASSGWNRLNVRYSLNTHNERLDGGKISGRPCSEHYLLLGRNSSGHPRASFDRL